MDGKQKQSKKQQQQQNQYQFGCIVSHRQCEYIVFNIILNAKS